MNLRVEDQAHGIIQSNIGSTSDVQKFRLYVEIYKTNTQQVVQLIVVQRNKHIFLLPTLQLTRQKGLYILQNNILFIICLPFLGLWSCSKNQRSPQHSESIGTLIYTATPSIHRSEPFLCFCQKSCGIKPGCANFHLINSWIETRQLLQNLAKYPFLQHCEEF